MTIVRLFLLSSLFITCFEVSPIYIVIIHSFVFKLLRYCYVNLHVVSLQSFIMLRRYLLLALLSFTIHVVFLVLWYFLSGLVVWDILVLFVSLIFTHSLSSNLLINSLSISFFSSARMSIHRATTFCKESAISSSSSLSFLCLFLVYLSRCLLTIHSHLAQLSLHRSITILLIVIYSVVILIIIVICIVSVIIISFSFMYSYVSIYISYISTVSNTVLYTLSGNIPKLPYL